MSLIDLDPDEVAAKLHKQPFLLHHKLVGSPYFELPQLVNLAQQLPRGQVEFNHGELKPGQTAETTPRLDKDPIEVIRDIEDQKAWMVLKRVDLIPEYREILRNFLEVMFAKSGCKDQRYTDLEGFIFIASANSTTPYHADAEENVLVHVRGEKYFHIWDNSEREFLSEEELEISPSTYRNKPYSESFETAAHVYKLEPGMGLHVPYMSPHWVHTGEGVAISMGMTWKTPEVLRMNKIRLMNGTLRRFGWPQRPPGLSPVKDKAKVIAHDLARALIDPLRKTESAKRLIRRVVYGENANYYY